MYLKPKYSFAGDRALVIEYGEEISPKINSRIKVMTSAIESSKLKGIIEVVPTYCSLIVHYNPFDIDYYTLMDKLDKLENRINNIDFCESRIIEIPTVYGGKYGVDIEEVAKTNGLSLEEVINVHTSKEYLVYMLGFTPGFAYLGGMDKKIETPRLKTPRIKIDAGSVGIAGSQTGIYPIDSPGGWQLIGRTPLKLYDPYNENPILLKSGDYIKFTKISEEEYLKIKEEIENGTYEYKIYTKQKRSA
ncbi:5-oxoprolinase subunit PxpB [Tepidibacter aestuarii]|uniref:5-oxoprolinase subunit PxpB n=1 Tax=Tepidibacter aestuarii TaxID=2925782 RepID=UPI0020BF2964|nr:5-oxoprolinase subunit PxpB [Tepidibacter aestuarii]CAH2214639.1 L-5-oxoprolinase (ATP-dependent) subunit B [Tepidibacter aestuarii]